MDRRSTSRLMLNTTVRDSARSALPMAAILGLLLVLPGCGLMNILHGPAPENDEAVALNAPTQPRDVGSARRIELNDALYNDPEIVSFQQTEDGRPAQRRVPDELGLYGELVSHAPRPTRQGMHDGGRNIMQVTFSSEGFIVDPDLSPDGEQLVFASTMHNYTEDIYVRPAIGSTPTQMTSDPARDLMPAFSPDGSQIAFASDRSGNWDLFVLTIDTMQVQQVTFSDDPELHPTWSPDGSMLAFCRLGAQRGRWEIWTLNMSHPRAQQRYLEDGMFPQWNPDPATSKILFQRPRERGSRYHSVWTIDFIGNEARRPTEIVSAANAATINPSWSPDGRHIVFATVLQPEHDAPEIKIQSDIWTVGLDGTQRMNLTNGQFSNTQPVWSPDGNVYFVSNRSGSANIWATPANVPSASMPAESGVVTASPDPAGSGNQP